MRLELDLADRHRREVANGPQARCTPGQPGNHGFLTCSSISYLLLLCSCLLSLPVELRSQATAHPQPGLRLLEVRPEKAEPSELPNRDQLLSSIAAVREALRANPDSARNYLSLGQALKAIGENESAWTAVCRAAELDPSLADAWYQKGVMQAEEQKWLGAAESFRKAVDASAGHGPAHLALAEMWIRLGSFGQAANELETVLRLNSKHPGAHYGLGLVHLQKGDLATAETEFRRALTFQPNSVAAGESLGETLVREHKWSEAVAVLNNVVAVNPDSLEAANALAIALQHCGQQEQASEEFRIARELSGRQVIFQRVQGAYNQGLVWWRAGQLKEAAGAFRSAISMDPDYADAHNNLGGVLWQMNDVAGALAEFQAAVRCNPAFAEAHNNWGSALIHAGETDGAIEHFRAAVASRPAFALAHFNLGRALLKKRELQEAKAELRGALILRPEMASAHIELGLALAVESGTLSADARAELAEGLRLDSRLRSSIPPEYLEGLH
jgi:tetratricopeptide (TPR) repeat protein